MLNAGAFGGLFLSLIGLFRVTSHRHACEMHQKDTNKKELILLKINESK